MKRVKMVVAGLVLVMACGGCQSTKTAGYAMRATAEADDTLSTCLKVDNGALARTLRIVSAHTDYTPQNFLRVQVAIINSGKRDRSCQYKFSWYGTDDMEVRVGAGSWLPMIFHGGEETRLEAVSPVPDAVSFKIEVRPLSAARKY